MMQRTFDALSVAACLVGLVLLGNAADLNAQDQLAANAGTLQWNTFVGASGSDEGRRCATDASGSVYVTGYSSATWGAPQRPHTGSVDAFVAKYSSSGSLVWNTFLGGAGQDIGDSIKVDSSGNVYVSGYSYGSWGAPVWPFVNWADVFVAKLDPNGSLLWNTFLGGPSDDYASGIALDDFGHVFVAGSSSATWSTPIRPMTATQEAFAAGIDSNSGLPLWNTFLGGTKWGMGNDVATDIDGNVYVAGFCSDTWGSPVSPYSSGTDGFLAKLVGRGWLQGALIWNTCLGGGADDYANGIAVDLNRNVYVAGHGYGSWGLPVWPYLSGDETFVAKFDMNGVRLWHSFCGGLGNDYCEDVGIGTSGSLYVCGTSDMSWGSPVRPYSAGQDAFVAMFDSNGLPAWNTFLGGDGYDYHGGDLALDNNETIYVLGSSEATWGAPLNPMAGGGPDAFLAKLGESGGSGVSITSITAKTSKPGSSATIKGTGFSTDKKKDVVWFGTKKATISKAKATSLKVTIPRVKKGIVDVYVEVNGQKSNVVQFQVK